MESKTLNVVLCWHMHQPQYKSEGHYTRPWTWLHAIKDYSDMAAHIEAVPGARAVVNFSSHLMLQLEDYSQLLRAHLQHGQPIGDHILDALGGELPDSVEKRRTLLKSCLRSHEVNIRQRFPAYDHLCALAEASLHATSLPAENDMFDLITWYCMAWMGEFTRRESTVIKRLMEQSGNFSVQDRRELLSLVSDVISSILPRYRKLAEQGKVELSITPWSHPILPLLLDFGSAREAMPDVDLPANPYPGGEARCNWHLDKAIEHFKSIFGFRPAGCWPSEGGLSQRTLELLRGHDFRWTASGTNVLKNSLGEQYRNGSNQHQLWSANIADQDGKSIACIFRDDELSDLPGFTYSQWRAEDAVNDLTWRLEHILDHCTEATPTVSIIMDGENAWEYYPENGHAFLSELYTRLSSHPRFRMSTFSSLLDSNDLKPLPGLVAGSWVYGNFSVWIGHPAKNRAWELLNAAKTAVDTALAADSDNDLPLDEVLEQLSVCESSDWFWWLGEEGRAEDGPAFDELFRVQLKALYRLINSVPPELLDLAIDDTHAQALEGATAGTMRQANSKDFP